MKRDSLTQKRLKELLRYDPDSGLFRWIRRTSCRISVGDVAGTDGPIGYRSIGVDGVRYLAHRLAWLYVTGEWPQQEIDHKNAIRNDNRWENLRDVSRRTNAQNVQRARADNVLGVLGVRPMRGRFQANIKFNGRMLNLGTYDTAQEAHAVYQRAKIGLHEGAG